MNDDKTTNDDLMNEDAKSNELLESNTNNKKRLIEFFYKFKFAIAGAVVVCIAALFFIISINNRPVKLSEKMEIKFIGYNGEGTVLIANLDEVTEYTFIVCGKRAGLSEEDSKSMKLLKPNGMDKKQDKYEKLFKIMDSYSYNFDKSSNLSNGDKINLIVKAKTKDSPFQEEKIEYVVSGLKEFKKVTKEELLKEHPVSFVGYEGCGNVEYDSSVFSMSSELSSTLKNGDVVKLTVLKSYIEDLRAVGKILENNEVVECTVSGLKEINEIANLPEIYERIVDYANSVNKNEDNDWSSESYVIEKQKEYILFESKEKSETGKLTVYTIFKISKTKTLKKTAYREEETTTSEEYKIYGYKNLDVVNNTLIQKDLDSKKVCFGSGYWSGDYAYQDLISAEAELKSSGYIEYVAKKPN